VKLRHVRLSFVKELKETVRDRRTLAVMVLFPLVVYPLLALIATQVTLNRTNTLEDETVVVGVQSADPEQPALQALVASRPERYALKAPATEADLRSGTVSVLARFGGPQTQSETQSETQGSEGHDAATERDEAQAASSSGGAGHVTLLYNATSDKSRLAHEEVSSYLAGLLPEGCSQIYAVISEDVASPDETGGYLLSRILPLVLVLMVMLGAIYPAIDATAGEHERGTLETTLVGPWQGRDLLLGKVLAVATLALMSGLANLASLSVTAVQALHLAAPDASIPVPWHRAAAAAAVIPLPALFFSALMVAVAATARSFKEAQNLLTPIYFLFLIPTSIAALGAFELTPGLALIPGLNMTLLARDLTLARVSGLNILLVVTSTLAYVAAALWYAARLFDPERLLSKPSKEKVRVHPRDAVSDARQQAVWRGGDAVALTAVALVLLFVSAPIQMHNLPVGVVLSQWVGMFGLVIVATRMRRVPFGATVRWNRPARGALLGALIVGLGAWIWVGLLTQWLFPAPPEVIEALEEQILDQGQRPLLLSLFLIGLTPAVCEEILFRGGVLRGLQHRLGGGGSWGAIIVSAALFAGFHLSAYRLVPTFALGLVLGWLAVKTGSIFPAMVTHFTNNTILLLLATLADSSQEIDDLNPASQAGLFALSLVITGAGIRMVKRSVSATPEPTTAHSGPAIASSDSVPRWANPNAGEAAAQPVEPRPAGAPDQPAESSADDS